MSIWDRETRSELFASHLTRVKASWLGFCGVDRSFWAGFKGDSGDPAIDLFVFFVLLASLASLRLLTPFNYCFFFWGGGYSLGFRVGGSRGLSPLP